MKNKRSNLISRKILKNKPKKKMLLLLENKVDKPWK